MRSAALPRIPVGWAWQFARTPSPAKVWIGIFVLWTLFLTGFLGSPGLNQTWRLRSLLAAKESHARQLEIEIRRLQLEAAQLERSRFIQQREIRRVLGYAAPDEIIFDFSAGDRL
jgi:cell division protein FtsB